MNLCDYQEIRPLLERNGFHFSKSMGQNFLTADWVPERIADAAELNEGCGVLEIGPGIGCLTDQLGRRAGKVAAIELDKRLLPPLREIFKERENIRIISGDALKTDLPALVREEFSSLTPKACANLPYQITTDLLTALVDAGCFETITVMVQREFAKRICAAPGTPDYSAFSVYANFHTVPEMLFDVPPDCFVPRPKVTSSVIHLRKRTEKAVPPEREKMFFAVVRASFAQRRKTLANGLSAAFSDRIPKSEITAILDRSGIGAGTRGETLGIPQFAVLAAALEDAILEKKTGNGEA